MRKKIMLVVFSAPSWSASGSPLLTRPGPPRRPRRYARLLVVVGSTSSANLHDVRNVADRASDGLPVLVDPLVHVLLARGDELPDKPPGDTRVVALYLGALAPVPGRHHVRINVGHAPVAPVLRGHLVLRVAPDPLDRLEHAK